MKMNVMLTPIIPRVIRLAESRRWRDGDLESRAANNSVWRVAA